MASDAAAGGACACWACWSADILNCCAIPLGALRAGGLALAAAGGGINPLDWPCGLFSAFLFGQECKLARVREGYAGR